MQKKYLKYLIGLSHFPKFGPVRLRKLKAYFPDYKSAFNAPASELQAAGLDGNLAREFAAARSGINPEAIMEKLDKENIQVAVPEDAYYPRLLKEIYDPPALLYYRGRLPDTEFNLGVVGARKFTAYGKRAVESIVPPLVRRGAAIVSGLALGIDTLSHNACLDSGGLTVAVLGAGPDRQSIYPASNRYLTDKIIDSGGCVMSEFPLGTPPLKHNFPQRNRIISGLSLGTLVVEAAERSGALITARNSLEQNRDVFAVPGSIFSLVSAGPNKLIKNGAVPVSSANDILEALNIEPAESSAPKRRPEPENEEEASIISRLDREPVHIDELIRQTGLETSIVSSTLTMMEMKGMVRNVGNMEYVLL